MSANRLGGHHARAHHVPPLGRAEERAARYCDERDVRSLLASGATPAQLAYLARGRSQAAIEALRRMARKGAGGDRYQAIVALGALGLGLAPAPRIEDDPAPTVEDLRRAMGWRNGQ